jgi:hypothetical protein
MKKRRISIRLSDFTRILFHGSVVVLVLLSMGLLAATASAKPTSFPPLQSLPTRPSAPAPPAPSEPPAPPTPSEPSAPPPASAPIPTAIEQPTTESTTTGEQSPDTLLTPGVDLTFEELGYSTFQFSEPRSRKVYLYLPRNLIPNHNESYLDLTISHAPPEPDKPSVIRVVLNDIPLAVITLSPENAEPTTYRLGLGNTPLTQGRNDLDISLDNGAACNIRGAMVDVAVYGSSLLHLEYSLTRHPPDLALYPIPFFEQSFKYEPVCVVLPHNPSVVDLSAAATIAAGLGKFSGGGIRLALAFDTSISTEMRNNHHLIVVGKKGVNRLLDRLDLPLRLDDPALSDEQGVIQELVSPWNPLRMILVVTGHSDEGLAKASQALNRKARLLGMQGPVAIVQTVFPPEPVEDQQRDVDLTLADLGYEEEVVYGTAPHQLDYHFDMPLSWAVTEEPRFTLYFSHASIADPTTSSLDVYFNYVPIESVLLDESNASEGILEVSPPSWLLSPGRNKLRLSIEMNLEDEDKCLFLDSQHLWTAIYSHSYLHLPFIPQDVEPALDHFPYPFNKMPNLSSVLLILPDPHQQLDHDLMLQVAAGLGAADRGDYLALNVTTADLVTQEDLQDKDLILIGRPSAHSLIAELNDRLPQPFKPGSDLPRPQLESVVLAQDPELNIGLIEELAAPWDAERTILVLTGTTDEGVALATTTLLYQRNELAGNVALIEESIGIQTYDTRSLLSTPRSELRRPDANQTLLIQLGERWW